ncbi:MAG: 16S rRNA (cytosine(1402)-N(4))-methyltransferase, partial [Longimicrobiales bacterium]
MVREVVEHLAPSRGGVFVDCTVGLGGHARALLAAGATRLIGIDRDPDALARAGEVLTAFGDRVSLVHGDYRNLVEVLDARGIGAVDGVLADLGVSSMQLDAPDRGFSFRRDE